MGFGLLAILAILLVVTGIHLTQVQDSFQASCKVARDCATAPDPVLGTGAGLQALVALIAMAAPAVLGIFLGAPLVARELEAGTFRLAWTQSVTRRRWLAAKLGVVGVATIALSALLTWLVDWWQGPLDAASQTRFDPVTFGFHGVVPIGYAVFAFALGVAAGVLLRRSVAAMAVTLVGFVVARVAVAEGLRPHLAPPAHESLSFLASRPVLTLQAPADALSLSPPLVTVPNGWVYSTELVERSGRLPAGNFLLHSCPALGKNLRLGPPPATAVHACLVKMSGSYHTLVTYQPASRFWPFQWTELGIFLAAAVALCGLTYWWLQRRYS